MLDLEASNLYIDESIGEFVDKKGWVKMFRKLSKFFGMQPNDHSPQMLQHEEREPWRPPRNQKSKERRDSVFRGDIYVYQAPCYASKFCKMLKTSTTGAAAPGCSGDDVDPACGATSTTATSAESSSSGSSSSSSAVGIHGRKPSLQAIPADLQPRDLRGFDLWTDDPRTRSGGSTAQKSTAAATTASSFYNFYNRGSKNATYTATAQQQQPRGIFGSCGNSTTPQRGVLPQRQLAAGGLPYSYNFLQHHSAANPSVMYGTAAPGGLPLGPHYNCFNTTSPPFSSSSSSSSYTANGGFPYFYKPQQRGPPGSSCAPPSFNNPASPAQNGGAFQHPGGEFFEQPRKVPSAAATQSLATMITAALGDGTSLKIDDFKRTDGSLDLEKFAELLAQSFPELQNLCEDVRAQTGNFHVKTAEELNSAAELFRTASEAERGSKSSTRSSGDSASTLRNPNDPLFGGQEQQLLSTAAAGEGAAETRAARHGALDQEQGAAALPPAAAFAEITIAMAAAQQHHHFEGECGAVQVQTQTEDQATSRDESPSASERNVNNDGAELDTSKTTNDDVLLRKAERTAAKTCEDHQRQETSLSSLCCSSSCTQEEDACNASAEQAAASLLQEDHETVPENNIENEDLERLRVIDDENLLALSDFVPHDEQTEDAVADADGVVLDSTITAGEDASLQKSATPQNSGKSVFGPVTTTKKLEASRQTGAIQMRGNLEERKNHLAWLREMKLKAEATSGAETERPKPVTTAVTVVDETKAAAGDAPDDESVPQWSSTQPAPSRSPVYSAFNLGAQSNSESVLTPRSSTPVKPPKPYLGKKKLLKGLLAEQEQLCNLGIKGTNLLSFKGGNKGKGKKGKGKKGAAAAFSPATLPAPAMVQQHQQHDIDAMQYEAATAAFQQAQAAAAAYHYYLNLGMAATANNTYDDEVPPPPPPPEEDHVKTSVHSKGFSAGGKGGQPTTTTRSTTPPRGRPPPGLTGPGEDFSDWFGYAAALQEEQTCSPPSSANLMQWFSSHYEESNKQTDDAFFYEEAYERLQQELAATADKNTLLTAEQHQI